MFFPLESTRHGDVQQHLREVQELLARQKVVENLVHRQDMPRHALVETLVHKQHVAGLQHKLDSLHPADIAYILESCSSNDTRFEIECYDIGHLYTAAHFLDRGLVKPPLFIQSVFGIRGGIGPHPEDVIHMKRTADRLFGNEYQWSVLGAGRNQMFVAAQSAVMGGNVRVGLEDSLWIGRGEPARSNADQVTKIRRILEELGLEVATPDDARKILKLKGKNNVNF